MLGNMYEIVKLKDNFYGNYITAVKQKTEKIDTIEQIQIR